MTSELKDLGRKLLYQPASGLVVFLVAISIVMTSIEPVYFTFQNWFNILGQAVFLVIIGIGMLFVLMAGGIDLSVGSVAGLTGGVAAWLILQGWPLAAAMPVAILAGTAIGAVNGLVITKLGIPDFVQTLAMLAIARGTLFVWTDGVPFTGYVTSGHRTLGGLSRLTWLITVPVLIAAGIALVASFVLSLTKLGQHVRATGSNSEAARLSGVNVDRVKIVAYMISGTLAGLAGVILAGRLTTVQAQMGSGLALETIAVAILGGAALTGGRGSVIGVILGAITLIVVQNVINLLNINPVWETLVVGITILIAASLARLTTVLLDRQALKQAIAM